ncbi:hypothetical protein ACNHFG_000306 [Yersinia enterocolitica]
MDEGNAALAASAVASLAALIGLVITKESKISEFRQAWVDELRKEIAEFITAYGKCVKHKDELAIYDMIRNFSMIKLRLNTSDSVGRSSELNNILIMEANRAIEAVQSKSIPIEANNDITVRILEVSNEIIRREWRRVKRGEFRYRIFFWGTAIVSSLLILYLMAPSSVKRFLEVLVTFVPKIGS